MSAPLLQVRDLRLSFGDQAVVGGINFDIEAGQKLALVGETGTQVEAAAHDLVAAHDNAAHHGVGAGSAATLCSLVEGEPHELLIATAHAPSPSASGAASGRPSRRRSAARRNSPTS
jgi:ABC-type glutathione transport system ATPase component